VKFDHDEVEGKGDNQMKRGIEGRMEKKGKKKEVRRKG
jgi:hypothetical protein